MALLTKKPTKMLEKPHVGAYSQSQALHIVVRETQTDCKEERLYAPVASFLHPLQTRGKSAWGGAKKLITWSKGK
jgi:hypothetical protein